MGAGVAVGSGASVAVGEGAGAGTAVAVGSSVGVEVAVGGGTSVVGSAGWVELLSQAMNARAEKITTVRRTIARRERDKQGLSKFSISALEGTTFYTESFQSVDFDPDCKDTATKVPSPSGGGLGWG